MAKAMEQAAHRARWFVYVDAGERIPWQATMRGTWGFDVVCSCGFETRTGGGTRRYVREQLDDHRREARTQAHVSSRK